MRCVIVLSGDIRDDAAARYWLENADRLICADGGARHLRRMQIRPDLLVGDMDSISEDDRLWLSDHQIPVRLFPPVKDQTDSELALNIALSQMPEPHSQHEIILLAAFGSRPDHVLANQLLAAIHAFEGWRLILTDGVTTQFSLAGGQTLELDLPTYDESQLALSISPINGPAKGLNCRDNLFYPLDDASLLPGSTRGISNRIIGRPVVIRLAEGVVLVSVTPDE